MNELSEKLANLSSSRLKLLAMGLQSRLDDLENRHKEPIAIIGMGCRFPGGANDLEKYWSLLEQGRDAIDKVPLDRWDADRYHDSDPEAPGKSYTRHGGFLKGWDISRFDAQFFGIPPREAAAMDPQQRLLLEVAWEALEHGGMAPSSLRGSRSGVYIGLMNNEFSLYQMARRNLTEIDAYAATGNGISFPAGRLSYLLGLHGPCMTLGTACSSSLVAVHLACQALRNHECSLALAGAVSLMLSPRTHVVLSRMKAISADGRSKAFDASADGYGRGEGCGVVVLKRLSDAQRDGDPIAAIIRGSAVNHDGPSGGLTVPNGPAQQAVISQALEFASISPSSIDYVEAHGSGTALGDPIELQALAAVLGAGRPADQPLLVGAVKTNIGHLEPAAGIAGLIKVVLSLLHRAIPMHLHLRRPNPHIPWNLLPIHIPIALTPWPDKSSPRRAGISSFGLSGINAHVILEQAPALELPAAPALELLPHLLTLSARSSAALRQLAVQYHDFLITHAEQRLDDICFTAQVGRSTLEHRLAIVASDRAAMAKKLSAFAAKENESGLYSGTVDPGYAPKIAFLFTGQGSQYMGMARQLFDVFPAFRDTLVKCNDLLLDTLPQPLLSILYPDGSSDDATTLLNQTIFTQPALFSLQVALANLWRTFGIEPVAVLGHSVGEYAAACVAGMMSLEDGLRLVVRRARLMQSLPEAGAMVVIFADPDQVQPLLAGLETTVSIAALNGPEEIVLSGSASSLDLILARADSAAFRAKKLNVSHAFHSHLLDPVLDSLEAEAKVISFARPQIDFISNLTGRAIGPNPLTPSYWKQQARSPVQFLTCLHSLRTSDVDVLVEIGPQPVLLGLARRVLTSSRFCFLPSLKQDRSPWQCMLEALATLATRGSAIDWRAVYSANSCRKIHIPTMPFLGQHFPLPSFEDELLSPTTASPLSKPNTVQVAGLAGSLQAAPFPLFVNQLDLTSYPFLADHKVYGRMLFPAAGWLEIAISASLSLHADSTPPVGLPATSLELHNARIQAPLFFELDPIEVHTTFRSIENDGQRIEIYSTANQSNVVRWTLHFSAEVYIKYSAPKNALATPSRIERASESELAAVYSQLYARGLELGPSFRRIVRLDKSAGKATAEIDASSAGHFNVHPGILDAAIQLIGAALPASAVSATDLFVPSSIQSLVVSLPVGAPNEGTQSTNATGHPPPGREELHSVHGQEPRLDGDGPVLFASARFDRSLPDGSLVADTALFTPAGFPILTLAGVELRRIPNPSRLQAESPAPTEMLYGLEWVVAPATTPPDVVLSEESAGGKARAGTCVLLAPSGTALVDRIAAQLEENGWVVRQSPTDLPLAQSPATDAGGVGAVLLIPECASDLSDLFEPYLYATSLALNVVQHITSTWTSQPPRLVIATRGVQALPSDVAPSHVELAGIWGLLASANAEHPELDMRCADLPLQPGPADLTQLVAELTTPDRETRVAYRQGIRYLARLAPLLLETSQRLRLPPDPSWKLQIVQRGTLDGLSIDPYPRRAPETGEVEIEVEATGLNFRDVLNTLGLYPDDIHFLGSECAGRIVAVGAGVAGLHPGEEVIALTDYGFARYATARASLVTAKPPSLNFDQAAALPVAYLTAYYALIELAHLGPDDRILIHAAAGGVGLAALQLARAAGAEVFATASPAKWPFMESLGVNHCLNSRTLAFADQIQEMTQGRGVTVVLNSLSGDFIGRSLDCLAPGGFFLEIGKREIWSPAAVSQLRPDVYYHVIALDRLLADQPEYGARLLQSVVQSVASAQYAPLPVQAFRIEEARAAFRHMAQGRHVGKVVLQVSPRNTPGEPRVRDRPIRPDATYLITGARGALGLQVASWLVEQGARHLVLVSRGLPTPTHESALDALRAVGAHLEWVELDVADAAGVGSLIQRLFAASPRLRGIVHSAGITRDAVLERQSATMIEEVAYSKVKGAWNLHRATMSQSLDFFVLFSSAASLLGSPAQANYAAANAFMDTLAIWRRAHELPAISIQWGAFRDAGMVARLEHRDRERMAEQGMETLTSNDAWKLLARLLESSPANVGVLPMAWSRLADRFSPGTEPPLLSQILRTARAREATRTLHTSASATGWVQQVRKANRVAGRALIHDRVRELACRVLALAPDAPLPTQRPLNELGLDSLTAVELKNAVGLTLGRNLPATLLFNYPTIDALTGFLEKEIHGIDIKAEVAPLTPAVLDEPIAIVGIGCRFPGGATDPDSFWELLIHGRDCITEVPAERFDIDAYYDPDPEAPGRTYTRFGSFLKDVDRFDAAFFGISPREAVAMDPQQRLLLEVSWEALEDAGVPPSFLHGSATGVFVGICTDDYSKIAAARSDPLEINAYSGTGVAFSVAAGRISYVLGLQGPNLAVDTACSSSLVTVHLACQSLRSGEATLALAGGVNLILSPEGLVYFSKLKAMSPVGRCKTFDDSADGYVRGEGCGIVVLKRLSDARRDGNRVVAVIRGSAVNQDGRSSGLTAPNGLAQEAVIRLALQQARVRPEDVGYIETHGSGTPLGDPIEVQAIGAVMGNSRSPDDPVYLGAVKTNVGHLEAAAGVVGLIKAALVVQRGILPPHLHVKTLNRHVPWQSLPVRIPYHQSPWPVAKTRRIAGVSSFGFSGTNAHIVVEADIPPVHPDSTATPLPPRPWNLLTLSARSLPALHAVARQYQALLEAEINEASTSDSSQPPLAALCYSAATSRDHHVYRWAIVGSDRQSIAGQLKEKLQLGPSASATPALTGGVSRRAFVYSGHGAQWQSMALDLWNFNPTFRDVIRRCNLTIQDEADFDLEQVLSADPLTRAWLEPGDQERVEVIQPTLFAVQLGFTAMLEDAGIYPDAVIGHSMGEITAACVSGALSIEDGLRLICARARLLAKVAGLGTMLALEASPERADELLADFAEGATVAVINGPASVVVSTPLDLMPSLSAYLDRHHILYRRVRTNVAFHSPQMESLVPELTKVARSIVASETRIPFYSTVTGAVVEGIKLTGDYWGQNLRQPVLFADALAKMVQHQYSVFVEISPHAILTPAISDVLRAVGTPVPVIPIGRRGQSSEKTFLEAIAALYTLGNDIRFKGILPSQPLGRALPLYPFQRERFWYEPDSTPSIRSFEAARPGLAWIARAQVAADRPEVSYCGAELELRRHRFLCDHVVNGETVFPASGFIELVLEALKVSHAPLPVRLQQLKLRTMLTFEPEIAAIVQLVVTREATGRFVVRVWSQLPKSDDATAWVLNAESYATSLPAPETNEEVLGDVDLPELINPADFYHQLRENGLSYGPHFQRIVGLRRGHGWAEADLDLGLQLGARVKDFIVHPALLDCCLQTIAAALPTDFVQSGTFVPVEIGNLDIIRPFSPQCRVQVRLTQAFHSKSDTLKADALVCDPAGRVLASMHGILLQRRATSSLATTDGSTFRVQWRELHQLQAWLTEVVPEHHATLPTSNSGTPRRSSFSVLVFADRSGFADALTNRLNSRPQVYVRTADEIDASDTGLARKGGLVKRPRAPEEFRSVIDSVSGPCGTPCKAVLFLWGLDQTNETALDMDRIYHEGPIALLQLVQVLVSSGWRDVPRLIVVTRGAQAADGDLANQPFQALLWGLSRTIEQEHPELDIRRLDLDPANRDERALDYLDQLLVSDWSELANPTPAAQPFMKENQLLFRGDRVLAARLEPEVLQPPAKEAEVAREASPDEPFHLRSERPGILDGLRLVSCDRPFPGEAEVEIEVRAAGLNFLDVLAALGILPTDAAANGAMVTPGMECAGTITRLGAGVTDFYVGQSVMALAAGCFSRFVCAPAMLTTPISAGWTFEEAATVPVAFLTAWQALVISGQLAARERVLIHAAAGGVGLAAVQIAQLLDAEIFATAGNATKRQFLKALGVSHVLDSRTLDFYPQIQAITANTATSDSARNRSEPGIDLVLNSLAGDFIDRSFELLRPFGRFIELGKRDYVQDRALNTRPFLKNLTFSLVDLRSMVQQRPRYVAGLLATLRPLLERGTLKPLPYQTFPARQAVDAFHHMAQARHIGKVILTFDANDPCPIFHVRGDIRAHATYLITGGLGGLGLKIASWLADEGARHLMLVGRTSPSFAATQQIQHLAARNVECRTACVDVADPIALKCMLEQTRASMPPLRGVIHGAMVLDDGVILRQDAKRFVAVLRPKVEGAWNLHQLTRSESLDFMVLMSSAASVLGSPGQANYAAANAFLDTLAAHRTSLGLPTVSINWGPWGEVGIAAEKHQGERFKFSGMSSLAPEYGLLALGKVLRSSLQQVAIMPLNIRQWQQFFPKIAGSTLFEKLLEPSERAVSTERSLIRRQLEAAPAEERRDMLEEYLVEQLAQVLRMPKERIDVRTPFKTLGIDSLMGLETRNRLETGLGITLSATMLWGYPNILALVGHLAEKMGLEVTAARVARTDLPVRDEEGIREEDALMAELDHLSDDELRDLIREL